MFIALTITIGMAFAFLVGLWAGKIDERNKTIDFMNQWKAEQDYEEMCRKCPPAPYRDELWHGAHTAKEQEEYEREVKEWNIQYAKWLKLMESLLRTPTKTDKK